MGVFVLAADESLKFWKLFEKKPGQRSLAQEGSLSGKNGGGSSAKSMTIR